MNFQVPPFSVKKYVIFFRLRRSIVVRRILLFCTCSACILSFFNQTCIIYTVVTGVTVTGKGYCVTGCVGYCLSKITLNLVCRCTCH
jgi:hypothetical protein